MPIYRYLLLSINLLKINRALPDGSAATKNYAPRTFIDIEANAADKADLDEILATQGFQFIAEDPPYTESLAVKDFLNASVVAQDTLSGLSGHFLDIQTLVNRRELFNDTENPLYVAGHTPLVGANGLVTNLNNILQERNEPNGFPNRTASTLTFDDGSLKLTVAPAISSFFFYSSSKKYTKSVAQEKVWANTEGVHFFYFDADGILQETQNKETIELAIRTMCPVAALYWDVTNQISTLYRADERHGFQMDGATHLWMHESIGLSYWEGLGFTGIPADGGGASDAHAEFGLENGEVADEDISYEIEDGSPQDISPIAKLPVLYRTGINGVWRAKTADNFPVVYNGTAGYVGTRCAYNQLTGGSWQFTEVGNNKFFNVFIIATNCILNPIKAILGQVEYGSVGAARTGVETEVGNLKLTGLPLAETCFLGALIFETATAFGNTPKARIRTVDAAGNTWVDFRRKTITGGGSSLTNHGLTHYSNGGDALTRGNIVQAFSTTTTDADPGANTFRLNNAAPGSATFIYVDDLAFDGRSIDALLQALSVDDRVYLRQQGTNAKSQIYRVTDVPTDAAGYTKIPVVSESAGTLFDDGAYVDFEIHCTRAQDVLTPNDQTGTAYTIALTDIGRLVTLSNANPVVVTVPKDATTNFPIGTQVDLVWKGVGEVSVAPEDGAITINSKDGNLTLAARYVGVTLKKIAANSWVLFGDLVA